MDRFSDAELMEQVRDRSDPEAFRTLADRWRPRLSAYFRPLLAEPAAVEDAVQEILIQLWTRRAAYTDRGRFSGYALTLAKHHWLNLRRREARRATEELAEPVAPERTEQVVLARVAREQAATVLAALPDGQRAVMELVEAGLSEREVASRLAVPVGTVKSRLHAARQRVREALEETDHAG